MKWRVMRLGPVRTVVHEDDVELYEGIGWTQEAGFFRLSSAERYTVILEEGEEGREYE